MDIIIKKLHKLQDLKYREFTAKSIPNISIDNIIGVRIPDIRNLAKEIKDEDYIDDFLNELPHKYQEENLLHGILLSLDKDIDRVLNRLDIFLKYADNWAVTDIISPKVFKKYPDKVYKYITKWIKSNSEYKIRFGVVSLLQYYLDDNFKLEHIDLIKSIKKDTYYINMAIAWYYSFALIKQYDKVISIFKNKELNKWIHNKSIQKACESYRITEDKKEYLRSLKMR
ncbi:MAG: DNA alkylation repair protein [Bacilli bacterium]|nr:DNA alkylation repair protein [Bacilli bacterium]